MSPPFPFTLRFWPLQWAGWVGLAVASLPLKLYFYPDLGTVLEVTLAREGFGFLFTWGVRTLWRALGAKIDHRPGRQMGLVLGFALLGAVADGMLMAGNARWVEPERVRDFQIVSGGYRALVLAIWGLLYFGLKAVRARQQMALAVRDAELQLLRSQLSPHFLFNALNALQACAHRAPEELPPLIQSLAGTLRYTLKHREGAFVPLREEVAALEDYLAIEQARFRGDLSVTFALAPQVGECPVPALVVQPLVENALKHGRATSEGPLRVRIGITRPTAGQVRVEVANTGRWRPPASAAEGFGIGLANLRHRLEFTYGQRATLTQMEAEGWVTLVLCLPLAPPHARIDH